jgi:hypothetical protein
MLSMHGEAEMTRRRSMPRRRFLQAAAAGMAALGSAAVRIARGAAAEDLLAASRDAYLYTLPLIEMAGARQRQYAAGVKLNQFAHRRRLADDTSRSVTTPNNDTLYSSAWLDLSRGPITLDVPASGDRYVSLALMDMYTNNFAILGTRTTGNGGGRFTIVGPGDAIAGSDPTVVRAPTPHVWALARILVLGPADLAAARAIQDGFIVHGPAILGLSPVAPRSASWRDYFAGASALLHADPPPAADRDLLARIAPLGIGPDLDFRPEAIKPEAAAAIEAGIAAARAIIASAASDAAFIQGWAYPRATLGNFGQDYVYRAMVAVGGLAALPPAEAMYMRAEGEGGSGRFDGRKPWRLHFAAGGLPPVDAFWSLSLYEATSDGRFFFAQNDAGRYAIGDRTAGLQPNADGSLDLWIAHDRPERQREANWLPAPAGPFALIFRAYMPKPALLNGLYRLPPITPAG